MNDENADELSTGGLGLIGGVVNLNKRQTYHALETGAFPAKKVRGKWVAVHGKLRTFFLDSTAA